MLVDASNNAVNTCLYSVYGAVDMATKKATNKSSNPTISVSLRIDPKTKYLIDLLARDQKRTITGVIEWAIERAAAQVQFDQNSGTYYNDMIDELWSTDEATRLTALALHKPSLLDYDQMRIWETVKASPDLWRSGYMPSPNLPIHAHALEVGIIRRYWDSIVEHVDQFRHSPAVKPFVLTSEQKKEAGISDSNFDDFPDELPF